MVLHNKMYTPDSRLIGRAVGQVALTANATVFTKTQLAKTRTEYVTQINIEAIDIANTDEEYRFVFECSNDSFSTVETAAIVSLGATGARLGGGPDNAAGDEYQIPWNTEINGKSYKDWRIRLEVAGTTPSIQFSMFIAAEG